MTIDRAAPGIQLPMERPLFTLVIRSVMESVLETATGEDVNTESLFKQIFVDKTVLQNNINQQLQTRNQVPLEQVIQQYIKQQLQSFAVAESELQNALTEQTVELQTLRNQLFICVAYRDGKDYSIQSFCIFTIMSVKC